VHLLTVLTAHDHIHILDEIVDNFEDLRSGCPSLILRESIKSRQDRFDLVIS
jgi:hypothetical protein